MINFLRINKNIKLGDYLHSNGTVDNIVSNDIIGVCVIPSNFLPDRRARFISMASMDSWDKENGIYTEEIKMAWHSDAGFGHDHNLLTRRNKVPLDHDSDGIVDGSDTFGYLPTYNTSNSILTQDNPLDPGTKFHPRTTYKIPSPYTPDGSFNPNFHCRRSEYDVWALTDYRGDLNTREVVYSIDPGEKYCPAFYCCERFSPGYRNNEWYLPAIGELAFIPPRLEIIRNKMKEAINAGSPGIILSNNSYWSSSEWGLACAWYVSMNYGLMNGAAKNDHLYVRAFLAI